ncbi:MAG: hypothetical protein BGO55_31695 [Sphingobacteriales bacterium 50-39]|nr:O-antigen ligase family protein [Sphingobacteriales bacterium]OJW61064.1 MAG: hypothetical protein BGO55_31695 [Sphingobacteriales bacterium 50-39]
MESLKKYFRTLDWPLLLFLIFFLNVKLYVKALAVIVAVCFSWKRRGALRSWRGMWWRFYPVMILLALINAGLSIRSMSLPAWMAFGLGCVYWGLAMLAAWQLFLFVEGASKERLHKTVSFLFLLNAGIMLASFILVCIRAGVLNPYNYEGEHRRFFISTGDMITGIGLDSSVTAALISAFGLLYFLYRCKWGLALLCYVTILLATSNTTNYLLGFVLVIAFLFYSDRLQKSMILIFFGLMAVFAAKVAPSNQEYAHTLLGRLGGKNEYVEPVPIPNAKWTEFVESNQMTQKEDKLHSFMSELYLPGQADSIKRQYTAWRMSGRVIAWQELGRFFREHPGRLLLGTGMGNFSSRLAFRTTGLGIEGSYPARYAYIHPFFRQNYLFLYLYYHTRDEGQHSVINKPDSVYGQLLSEYGLIGVGCFVILYLAAFGRGLWKRPVRSYGAPLLLLMAGAFFTEYWFEQLSVVVLFELLMLLDKHAAG